MTTELNQLTDEELLALDPSTFAQTEEVEEQEEEEQPNPTDEEQEQEEVQEEQSTQPAEEEPQEDQEQSPSEDEQVAAEPTKDDEVVNDNKETDVKEDEEKVEEQPDTEETTVDYKAFYDFLTKPFKANGKEIQVSNPQDMITLMQQGANYSKRMAGLKPSLGYLKLLETHDLLNEEKLGFLIDLNNKKPEAIAKLVKDSNIDLYSFNTDAANGYEPKAQVEPYSDFNATVSELSAEQNDTFSKVMKMVTDSDAQSQQVIYNNPQVLRVMNEQAANGLFEKITNAIDYERMMGRMVNVPFLQAYQEMEAIFLNKANPQQPSQQPPQQQQFTAPRPKATKAVTPNPVTENKRKATTPSNSKPVVQPEYDPLKLSDDEIMKLMGQEQYH